MCLFLAGLALTIHSVTIVLLEYFSSLIVTTVTKSHSEFLEFPAVTICPNNRIHCTNLHERIEWRLANPQASDSRILGTLCELFVLTRCDASHLTARLFDAYDESASFSTICAFLGNDTINHLKDPDGDSQLLKDFLMLNLYDSLPESEMIAIAHQPDDLIKECTWMNEVSQSCREFMNGSKTFVAPYIGVCYSFNYETDEALQVSLVGELYGLNLELNVNSMNTMQGGFTPSLGVRLILHERDKLPLTSTAGISLGTNTETNIVIRALKNTRQPAPFPSECLDDWPDDVKETLNGVDIKYQDNLCQSFCLDQFIQDACNCTLTLVLDYDRQLSHRCQLHDPIEGLCVSEIASPHSLKKLTKSCTQCRPSCEETRFETHVNGLTWPSQYYWAHLAEKYNVTFQGNVIESKKVVDHNALSLVSDDPDIDDVNEVLRKIEQLILLEKAF